MITHPIIRQMLVPSHRIQFAAAMRAIVRANIREISELGDHATIQQQLAWNLLVIAAASCSLTIDNTIAQHGGYDLRVVSPAAAAVDLARLEDSRD